MNELCLYDNGTQGRLSVINILLIVLSLLLALYFTASWLKGKKVFKHSRIGRHNMVLRQMGAYICVVVNILMFVLVGINVKAAPSVFNNWTIVILSFMVVQLGFMFIEVQSLYGQG